MRIEPSGPGHAEVVLEVGDRVALVDVDTMRILAGPSRIEQLPAQFVWPVLHDGRGAWAVLDNDGAVLAYFDAQPVRRHDEYRLDVPDRRSR